MKPDQIDRFRYLAVLWLAGSVALACVTWACFRLGLGFATTAFVYLIVIVLLSLMDSFISSAIFSAIAIGCLNYFFVEPRFTFQVNYAEDLATLTAFLLTAFVVTGLVRRARRSAEVQRERARLLDLTHDAIFVRDMDDVITYWNHGAELLYGWARHEAVGKVKHDLLRTVFPVSFEEAKATLLRTGRWEGELVHTKRDGARVSVESRWSLQLDDNGSSRGTLETNHDITERKHAEEALRRSQAAYLAEAQKLSLTGSFGWNVSSGEIFWSEESFRIFAYDPATKPSIELVVKRVHPDDVALVQQVIDRAARDKQDFDFEHRLLMPDGSVKHLHVVARAAADEPSKPQFVGAVMDISARKKTEEALRYSEHRYHNLFQAMAASFWELDFSGVVAMLRSLREAGVTDFSRYFQQNPGFVREMMRATRVVDVNDQTVKLFGRGNKEELLGNVEPFWPEESTHVYAKSILESVTGKPHYSSECKLRRIDGNLFDALFTAAFPPETMGKGTLMVGVIDVTERKQAYAALEQSEQRYRHLFHHMPIPLLQINSSGLVAVMTELREQGVTDLASYMQTHPEFLRRAMDGAAVEQVNESAVRLLGARDAQELLGPVAPYWKDSPEVYERILLARFRGEDAYQEEMKVTTRDGRVIEGMFTVAFPPALAKLGITLNAFVDATDKNRAQARLQQVEADFAHAARVSMLGELTASIAHEVNQPLAAIATNGEAGLRWLARPEPDVAEVRELTKRIVADARRAADVISRIRAMAARRVPEQTPLSLDEVVREALLFLRHEVQARGVTVTHHPAPSAPRVLADRTQLQQVIVNLAVNAMQAMAQAGGSERRILIRTDAPDAATVRCAIEDSGPGIKPEHLVRLFESFFTTKDGGMGMGLPICRSIIEAHGGRITADNEGAHGGARFSFTLPAASKPH